MASIDPEHIRLSRRKLVCSTCERRDTYNLRKLVLINNSILSAESSLLVDQYPPSPSSVSLDHEDFDSDDENESYIFPDVSSSWTSDAGHEGASVDDLWLEAVLSDLDDDGVVVQDADDDDFGEYYVHRRLDNNLVIGSSASRPPSPHSEPPYISSPSQEPLYIRQPLPKPAPYPIMDCSCDDLPFFDDASDGYSDDSEEPSTPGLLSERDVSASGSSTSMSPTSPLNTHSNYQNAAYLHKSSPVDYFTCQSYRVYDY